MKIPFFTPETVHALDAVRITDTSYAVPSGSVQNLMTRIGGNVLNLLLLIAGILAVLYIVYQGIMYITAGGNAERTKAARGAIINTIYGIIIVVAAYGIVRIGIQLGNTIVASLPGPG